LQFLLISSSLAGAPGVKKLLAYEKEVNEELAKTALSGHRSRANFSRNFFDGSGA
jgi:hypothetical protein